MVSSQGPSFNSAARTDIRHPGAQGTSFHHLMLECALIVVPFTRASSAGLAGKRAAACLRLEEPSSADPRQAEQRSEPEGPRSRVPRGIAKGGRASGPPWLAVKGERLTRQQLHLRAHHQSTRHTPGSTFNSVSNSRAAFSDDAGFCPVTNRPSTNTYSPQSSPLL